MSTKLTKNFKWSPQFFLKRFLIQFFWNYKLSITRLIHHDLLLKMPQRILNTDMQAREMESNYLFLLFALPYIVKHDKVSDFVCEIIKVNDTDKLEAFRWRSLLQTTFIRALMSCWSIFKWNFIFLRCASYELTA
jgi:hypothetical protein